jgi:hypothetical protein
MTLAGGAKLKGMIPSDDFECHPQGSVISNQRFVAVNRQKM